MRTRRGWLWPLVVVLLVAVPILEVWLLIQVGRQIGALPTIAILVAEAALGAWLMKREGSRAWRALTDAQQTGRMPTGELADAALVLVGGVLLMLPGFATDLIGFFFLLPFTRPLARSLLGFFIARQVSGLGLSALSRQPGAADVIPGETVSSPNADAAPRNPDPHNPLIIPGETDGRR